MTIQSRLPNVRVVLALTGDTLDFAALERARLPEPHFKFRKGDYTASGRPPAPETVWAYECREAADDIESPINHLLDTVDQYRVAIRGVVHELGVNCKLLVTVTIEDDRPLYELDAHTMGRLASLGADFSLDIFDYTDQ